MTNAEKYVAIPTKCNLCGGEVIYTSNNYIYGREYGNGKCYLCKKCGAYTGVHTGTRRALGILADKKMREMKIKCHDKFDKMWKTTKQRNDMYEVLAHEMGIPREHCHFGHFDLEELETAYKILTDFEEVYLDD